MDRQEVYETIDSERAYQIQQTSAQAPKMNPDLSIGDFILAMQEQLEQARTIWYNDSPPYYNTTEFIRKTAALSVACMEKYGARKRLLK